MDQQCKQESADTLSLVTIQARHVTAKLTVELLWQ